MTCATQKYSIGTKGSQMAKPKALYLLRKSRSGNDAQVVRRDDFPLRINHEGHTYVINRTKAGKVIMTREETV